jgi:acyl dehydratase
VSVVEVVSAVPSRDDVVAGYLEFVAGRCHTHYGGEPERLEMTDLYFEDIEIGDVEETAPLPADRDEMIAYAGANDPFPIHLDPAVAAAMGFGDVIASFGYTISLYLRLVHKLDTIRSAQAGFVGVLSWEVTFGAAVRPGDDLRMRHTVVDKRLTSRGDRGLITSRNELLNQRDEIPVSIDAMWLLATQPT